MSAPEPAAVLREGAPEQVIARLRPHGRVLFWPSVLLVVICAALGFFTGKLPAAWMNQALWIVGVVLIALVWLLPLLAWSGRHYTITTRRIIIKRGLFVRTRQELMHTRGYDLTVRKNGMQSLFGSGDVLINSGLERPVVLWDVPSADLVQSTLHDLMEENISAVARMRQQEQTLPPDASTYWGGR
ncbi:PH domain-containing protein [Frondihabitans australicus]|uniref:Membrane protein YdbS with pleckstrin-like domain n=1 Tax=Frondihabitans australicus TaxID=386892 RepID=A0A495IBB5_9MICO|nr:PH domain-containing protein [Frondihabitans australicus]RKR73219.1 membrane protein YdbS with pleckstrin-like domain [Frondihabitans australicus]